MVDPVQSTHLLCAAQCMLNAWFVTSHTKLLGPCEVSIGNFLRDIQFPMMQHQLRYIDEAKGIVMR